MRTVILQNLFIVAITAAIWYVFDGHASQLLIFLLIVVLLLPRTNSEPEKEKELMYPEIDGVEPFIFSGDGKNVFPGNMTCPFVIYDLPSGDSIQFTVSSKDDAGQEDHFIKSVLRYKTPERPKPNKAM